MDRRSFLAAAGAAIALGPATAMSSGAPSAGPRTQWRVGSSEGLDAVVFLGPLSGGSLYREFYAAEADAFAAKLPAAVRADIPKLWTEAGNTSFGLLGPSLATVMSGTDCSSLDKCIAALATPDVALKPALRASPYWGDADWAWLMANLPRLQAIFSSMRDAGFAAFRQAHLPGDFDARLAAERQALSQYDVIKWQEKLTGRTFDPVIDVVVLQFVKPHGIKVQGQTFLHAAGYPTAITVQIAAHEMLHPPVPTNGDAWKAAVTETSRDPLIAKIVAEHDRQWGYTNLPGLLNEDICQALDQLISEALGVANNPADRWHDSDDGIHVLAAGIYGLLRQDHWVETGGNFEAWLKKAVADGRFAPRNLHPIAARVLERPLDALWPLRPSTAPSPGRGTTDEY